MNDRLGVLVLAGLILLALLALTFGSPPLFWLLFGAALGWVVGTPTCRPSHASLCVLGSATGTSPTRPASVRSAGSFAAGQSVADCPLTGVGR